MAIRSERLWCAGYAARMKAWASLAGYVLLCFKASYWPGMCTLSHDPVV